MGEPETSRPQARDLIATLKKIRDLRAWSVKRHIDPWAFRQALIIAMELDTKAALDRGIPRGGLEKFDKVARMDAQRWLDERNGTI